MTPQVCFHECLNQGQNIKFYGIKNGTDCYCGSKLSYHGDFNGYEVPRSACNINCPGDPRQKCGGASELNLYSITGMMSHH